MKVITSFLLLAFLSGCASTAELIDRQIETDGKLQLLYGTSSIRLYYDPLSQRCIMHSAMDRPGRDNIGVGVGIDTFECDPAEIQLRVAKQAQPSTPEEQHANKRDQSRAEDVRSGGADTTSRLP